MSEQNPILTALSSMDPATIEALKALLLGTGNSSSSSSSKANSATINGHPGFTFKYQPKRGAAPKIATLSVALPNAKLKGRKGLVPCPAISCDSGRYVFDLKASTIAKHGSADAPCTFCNPPATKTRPASAHPGYVTAEQAAGYVASPKVYWNAKNAGMLQ